MSHLDPPQVSPRWSEGLSHLFTDHADRAPLCVLAGGREDRFQAHSLLYARGADSAWDKRAAAHGVDGVSLTHEVVTAWIPSDMKALHGACAPENEWFLNWLWSLHKAAGAPLAPGGVEKSLADLGTHRRMIFVVPELERTFRQVHADPIQQRAVRVLITDVLEWLRNLPGRPFGLVILADRETLSGALPNNYAQFMNRFERYAIG